MIWYDCLKFLAYLPNRFDKKWERASVLYNNLNHSILKLTEVFIVLHSNALYCVQAF